MTAGRRGSLFAVFVVGWFATGAASFAAEEPAEPKVKPKPPVVEFKKESTRHPDPTEAFEGNLKFKEDYEWDDLPLAEGGRIMVIYAAKSDAGIRTANIRYRVVAKGVAVADYPEEYRKVQHPRDDPKALVFAKLELKPFEGDPEKLKLGKFVPDLGLFEKSWDGLTGLKRADRFKVNVECYVYPNGKEAGGRYWFEVESLKKTVPDGKGGVKSEKIAVGDAVELFVEVLDKGTKPDGTPGYTPAKRKTVVTEEDAFRIIKEQSDKKLPKLPEKSPEF